MISQHTKVLVEMHSLDKSLKIFEGLVLVLKKKVLFTSVIIISKIHIVTFDTQNLTFKLHSRNLHEKRNLFPLQSGKKRGYKLIP